MVPYELASRMKALGFDEPCLKAYDKNGMLYHSHKTDKLFTVLNSNLSTQCSAPLLSQAFRWFREKHGLSGWVDESFGGSLRRGVVSIKSEIGSEYYPTTTKLFYTYEEAELDCLTNLIEIVEQKENI